MTKISVIIITLNEENNIEACIRSCKCFDEIVVIDSGSTDKTIPIAKKLGAIVFSKKWQGYGPQKRYAINKTSNNWVLSIDADEFLSNKLQREILSLNLIDKSVAYSFNRRSYFLGKEVLHCGWNPDWVTRLFNKEVCSISDDLIHEKVIGDFENIKLGNLMHHNTYPTEADISKKTISYGDLGKASRKRKKNRFLASSWAFIRTFIVKLGFLDGYIGYRIAKMNAKVTFMKYS